MNEEAMTGSTSLERERKWIFEMIDASAQLAAQIGPHPLSPECECIACANRRKQMIWGRNSEWKHRI